MSTIKGIVINKVLNQHLYLAPEDVLVYAIGDVHGCNNEFEEMCRRMVTHAENQNKKAVIYSLGDLIDRGPGFYEVFDVAKRYDVRLIKGNHELNFVLERYGHKHCRSKERRKSHHVFDSLSSIQQQEVLDYIVSGDRYAEVVTPTTDFLLSHAPVVGEETSTPNMKTLWTYCSRNTPYIDSMLNSDGGSMVYVHGHQHWNYTPISDEDLVLKDSFNIDGGVVYGGALVGLCLNTLDLFEVQALRTYYDK